MTPEEFFAESTIGRATYERLCGRMTNIGRFEVRVSKSQVALRRRRGFAYLWLPGRYLTHAQAEVVLSLALDHELDSVRFKEIAHPTSGVWQHHLEIHAVDDIDDEVEGWLREAYASAA